MPNFVGLIRSENENNINKTIRNRKKLVDR
jgi:hypothetical protein